MIAEGRGAYAQLYELSKMRSDLKVIVELLGPDGEPAKGRAVMGRTVEQPEPEGILRVRVLRHGEVWAGAWQSRPGGEHIDVLAERCIEVLRRKGIAAE